MATILIIVTVLVVATLAYWLVLRPWHARWGATAEEAAKPLPGDDIAAQANMVSTRAVTIRAAADKVWPWLVQMGQGRGGMYSYERLENLIGCDIHNTDRILPEFQHLEPGDVIRLGPEGYPFYRVAAIEPGRVLVLRPGDPKTKEPGPGSWALVLEERKDGSTRLLARQRLLYRPTAGNFLLWRVVTEPISFVMEQKMLRTIRQLAEESQ